MLPLPPEHSPIIPPQIHGQEKWDPEKLSRPSSHRTFLTGFNLDFIPDANNGGMSDMKFRIIVTLLLCAPLLLSQDFNGQVAAISDGDTITVMHEGRSEKIRLHGIDAL